MSTDLRPSRACVDLGALAHNVELLTRHARSAALCVIVKADAYGHGAVECAGAALAAGAESLGVALVEEARELRAAGIAAPVLLLSEPPAGSEAEIVTLGVEPTVYTTDCVQALDSAAAAQRCRAGVHLKIDTGMRRVGAEPDDAVELAKQIDAAANLDLTATWTHFAVADEPEDPFTHEQADLFDGVIAALQEAGIDPGRLHASNSAGLLRDPDRFGYDMVRAGITVYGVPPCRDLAGVLDLEPVMGLESEFTYVRPVPAGTRVSYGRRYATPGSGFLGTVPLGYADGVRRGLSGRMDVIVRGRRHPIAGTVTMDQFMVDLGAYECGAGEHVTLIGSQGDETITALDWADALGTIGYEVTCGIGARVPRIYINEQHGDAMSEAREPMTESDA